VPSTGSSAVARGPLGRIRTPSRQSAGAQHHRAVRTGV
jgi:hypothetical protein